MTGLLSGRVAVVTGAGSGIGRAIAHRFHAEGGNVLVADIDPAGARHTAGEIGDAATACVADVTDRPEAHAMVAACLARFGRLDVLVNNAGAATDTPFEQLTDEEWSRDVDVCLRGPFLCSQAALPHLVASEHGGVIINVGSINAVQYFGNDAYSAAKAGLTSLTRSLAVRYGPRGVRVNLVAPATVRTGAWEARLRADPGMLARLARHYPLGRIGTVEEVAAACAFLASDQASWITGVTLPIDGGLTAGNIAVANDILRPSTTPEANP